MYTGTIASRYAHAILGYVRKNGQTESTAHYFNTLEKVMESSPELIDALRNPVLEQRQKEQLLLIAAGAGTDKTFRRIINLILLNKREQYLPFIALQYIELYRSDKNLADVRLTTAVGIDAETVQKIAKKIETVIHKTVNLYLEVDPGLIGGYIIEYDNYRYDASIRARLKQIQVKLRGDLN